MAGNSKNFEIYLADVRCSHPHLFEPQSYKKDPSSKPRYSCSFILDKKKHKALIAEIEDAIEDAKVAEWGKKVPRIKEDDICLQDGDDLDRPEYVGCMVLKSASPEAQPPKVLGRNKAPLTPRDGKPYGGCYVNAIVNIYPFAKYGNQINASLEVVQYFRKGESFGKGPADTSRFEDYGDDDDDEGESEPVRGRSRSRDDDEPPRRSRRPDRDEEEDAPPRRRASRDEEDDAPPRRRASRDEEDDDAPPRRRASRDEEEDERPARRRSRDDD